jgi:iron-sulfur cluster insertion protein
VRAGRRLKETAMTVTATTAATTTAAATPSAPFLVTPAAAQKVSELVAEEGNPALKLRIYVTGGGCSGFQYGFAFEEADAPDDLRIDTAGATVVVDPMSLQYLTGAEIDFEDGLEGARFVIRNPNATTTCGCGSSFSV